ncbi:MAG: toll/interleukin-1 receptor domain-containing protein [Lachnospiraceae bacterium]|nr:toll/interleukin-1 receptor domain-containing protein [Lachnospiraceae bacterium]
MDIENENVTSEEKKGSYEVFISYSTKNKNVADAVVADFENNGIRCWYAPRDILPGQEWVSAIKEGLNSAKVFVLIFTEESNLSRQVMNEVALAFNASKTIVPFRLTEEMMNDELEYYLTRVHWLDAVSKPLERSIEALRKYVEVILQKPGKSVAHASAAKAENVPVKTENAPARADNAPAEKTAAKASSKSKLALWIAIAAAALLLIGLGVFAAVKLSGPKASDLMAQGYEAFYFGSKGTEDDAKAKELYEKAAQKGVADAYYYLGKICEREYDYQAAREEYEKGMEAGSDLARLGMGYLYQRGLSGEADMKKAWELYNEALDNGCVEADYFRAQIIAAGLAGQEANATKAVSLYKNVIDESKLPHFVGDAYLKLGEIYRKGMMGVPSDLDAAMDAYEKGYEAMKCKNAKFIKESDMAMVYKAKQEEVKADDHYRAAFELCKEMADAGSIYNMYWCGYCCQYGMGTQKDEAEAVRWYVAANDAAKARNENARCYEALYAMGNLSSADGDYEKAYAYHKEASDVGYGKAANAIGDLYYNGQRGADAEGNPDFQMARQWYDKAIEHGCTDAYQSIGVIYSEGKIGEADNEKALEYYKRGAELGSGACAYNVAIVYQRNEEYEDALKWYEKAADFGYADSYYAIGLFYDLCYVEGGSADLALENYVKAMQEGCSRKFQPFVTEYIAEIYYNGESDCGPLSSGKDMEKAFYWAQKGAELGSADCMNLLWEMYYYGQGPNGVNTTEALNWLTKAAEAGDVDAMIQLGQVLIEGADGIQKNEKEGLSWLIKAGDEGSQNALIKACNYAYNLGYYDFAFRASTDLAEMGLEDAVLYHRLGWMYYNGKGTKEDDASAIVWYEKAYSAGATLRNDELVFIAYAYYLGQIVKADVPRSYQYFKAAADAGDGIAMAFLGSFFEYGIENYLSPNPELALQWYGKAIDNGDLDEDYAEGTRDDIRRLVEKGLVSWEAASKWLQ